VGPAGEESGERAAMGGRTDDGVSYAAGSAAPPASPASSGVADDREVDFGVPFVPTAAADAMLAAGGDALDAMGAIDAAPPRSQRAEQRPAPPTQGAVPATPNPLRTDDGRLVSVVHIVAELAPFARTGGLGEAVKSLA